MTGLMSAQSTEPSTRRSRDHAGLCDDVAVVHALVLASAFLIAVFDDLGWDVSADVILLTASLRGCGSTGDRHRGTRSVMDEIWSGRNA